MAIPVLATKLYIPSPPPKFITRSRLINRLSEGRSAGRKLTLISAPAGFGKSTLVSEWITSPRQLTAWLSLDENDNDPTRFLVYLISALQTLSPNLGAEILHALQSQQALPIETVLTALLNELTTIPNGFVLVLDDYHLTDHRSIDDALTFLIDHLPPQIHLVITTREDPSLPIPRLRARNQLTELRAADLRFTASEAAEFLNHVMDLRLSAEDVAALETRTEGWIAGLQLAALSMQGRQDVSGFVQSFAGDNRYIVDYLVEEVLRRQTDSIHSFLLQTVILDRLNGSLCEAVTGQPGGKEKLEALQRGNFFLIPLDDRRHWYRYHHLFADVLRMYLIAEQPEQVPVLHRRASEWYEQNGSPAEAIRHALAGADFERAAELIERALPIMRQTRQEATLLGWLQALPEAVFKRRPILNVHYAGTLLQNGQLGGVSSRLQAIERWLETPADIREQPIFVDEQELQRVPGAVAMYRAAIALTQGDVDHSMQYAQRVLDLVRDDDSFMRGAASSLLGLASWTRGDLDTAYEMFSKGMNHLQRFGFISDVIGGAVTLADIRITQGRLRDAMTIYERGLRLATEQGTPALRGAADMYVGMSDIHRERNDLHAATQSLMKSKELGDFNGLPKNPYRWRVAMARIQQTRGEWNEALDTLNEAEPLYVGDFSPNVRPISALKARVWIAQGRLDEAITWTRQNGLSVDDDLSYLREFEYITLARLLLARFEDDGSDSMLDEAIHLLDRLLKAAQDGGRMGSLIEILILRALAYQLHDDIPTALQSLEHALSLGAPEGYERIFVDEGANMAQLIQEAAMRGIMPEYTSRLLSTFDVEAKSPAGESSHSAPPASSSPIEPLSQRELDILRLFKTELSGPEIAQELVIALSTVRTHTKSIYSKLNVNSRRGAVKRAMELGLI